MIDQDPSQKYVSANDKGPLRLNRRRFGQLAGGLYFARYLDQSPALMALQQFKDGLPIMKPKAPADIESDPSSKLETPIGTRIVEYQSKDNSGRLFLLPNKDITRVLRDEPNVKLSAETNAYLDTFVEKTADLRVITAGMHTKTQTLAPFILGANIGTFDLTTAFAESRGLTEEEIKTVGVMVIVWKDRQIIDAAAADSNYDPLRYSFRFKNIASPSSVITP